MRMCAAPDCRRQMVGDARYCHEHETVPDPHRKGLWGDLRSGLGVEDIAIKRGCDQAYVRAYIAELRANGGLRVLYGRKR